MDLFAYTQIDRFKDLMEQNGISIPRLRGYRWMAEESLVERDVIEEASRKLKKEYLAFNRHVGEKDVMYVHARIGGNNWKPNGGPELEKQPWFIERVDDAMDGTYCDIYVRLSILPDEMGKEKLETS